MRAQTAGKVNKQTVMEPLSYLVVNNWPSIFPANTSKFKECTVFGLASKWQTMNGTHKKKTVVRVAGAK